MILDRVDEVLRNNGLRPIDEHIQKVMKSVKKHPMGPYRSLGATTWMCARIAVAMMDAETVRLVGRNITHEVETARLVYDLIQRVPGSPTLSRTGIGYRFSNRARLVWAKEDRLKGLALTATYRDDDWALRLQRRATGPYAMIREVRLLDGRWVAFAEDDEELMELHEEALPEVKDMGCPIWMERQVRQSKRSKA